MAVNNRVNDFDEFNKALDSLMTGNDFNKEAVSAATLSDGGNFDSPHERMGKGGLIVQVSMASGALPLYGAKVTVTDSDGNVVAELTTDNSGRTPRIELDAPASQYSQQPGTVRPYSAYNIIIEYPGFFTERFLNIAVFDKIDSIQPVSLEPLGEDSKENDNITIDEQSGNNNLTEQEKGE